MPARWRNANSRSTTWRPRWQLRAHAVHRPDVPPAGDRPGRRGELLPLARLLYSALAQDPGDAGGDSRPDLVGCAVLRGGLRRLRLRVGQRGGAVRAYFAAGRGGRRARHAAGQRLLPRPAMRLLAHPPGAEERPPYLGDTPYPVFVLGATWDPYTPYPNARAAGRPTWATRTAITQPGGPHVICLRGEPCPDDILVAYLLDGELPASREIECEFIGVDPYVPIPAASVDDYEIDARGAAARSMTRSTTPRTAGTGTASSR